MGFFDGMGGGIASGAMAMGGAMLSAKASSKARRKQEDFAQYMRSTAHQTEVDDLRKAGLNPILSAGGSGAQGQAVQQQQVPDYARAMTSGVSTGAQLANTKQDIALKNIEVELRGGMLKWLQGNPEYKDLFYGMMAANRAGVSGDKALAGLGINSAVRGLTGTNLIDSLKRMWNGLNTGGSTELSPAENEAFNQKWIQDSSHRKGLLELHTTRKVPYKKERR